MGKLTVVIDNELERKFRVEIAETGGKHGGLKIAIEYAIKSWLFERYLNVFKSYCRPILWGKPHELKKFDDCIKSIRNSISDIYIDEKYRFNINISPKEIYEAVEEIRKSLLELDEILPKDCKEKHFKNLKDLIDRIIEETLKSVGKKASA